VVVFTANHLTGKQNSTENSQTKYKSKKQNAKQNYPGSVTSYDTR